MNIEEAEEILNKRMFNFELNKSISSIEKMDKRAVLESEAIKIILGNLDAFADINRQQEKEIEILKAELKKKDKIIDELENIFYNYQLCEYEITDCTYRKCEYIGEDETPPCKECIKQYFERKVEDVKN